MKLFIQKLLVMNQKIKAAAEIYSNERDKYPFKEVAVYGAFISGADYFKKFSGADEMAGALKQALAYHDGQDDHSEFGWKGYAEAALAKYNSFIKKEEDGKD